MLTVTALTTDAASPRPLGFGFSTFAVDIANALGESGGDITTPFFSKEDIEIEAWTPTGFPSAVPAITGTTVNAAGKVVVTIETDIDAAGRIRLAGRGM